MKEDELRKMFIAWVKSTSWHPCGLEYVLEQDDAGMFTSSGVDDMFLAYCAGIRKGIKLQKAKEKK